MEITRRWLDTLKPKDGSEHGTRYQDSDLAGFFVSVYATGRVAFGVRFRANGIRREVRLGDFPAVTPEDARKAALAVLGGAARGVDEAEKRRAAREAAQGKAERITFRAWREQYARDIVSHLKRQRDPLRYLAMAGEAWDARPLAEITARDVETFRNRLAPRGSTQANRWLAHLGAAFGHAVRLGHVEKNPCVNVRPFAENAPRQRVLSDDEEARLRKVLASWEDPFERVALVLLLDTGARLSEVLRAKWEDFDLDDDHAGVWHLPRTKSGRAQAVPVLANVGAVVVATPKLDGSPYIAAGRTAGPRSELSKPWARMRDAARLGPDVHLHDLRRSFGLRVTRTAGIFAASKLLRHSSTRITEAVYAPLSVEDVRGFATVTETARVLAFESKGKKAAAK